MDEFAIPPLPLLSLEEDFPQDYTSEEVDLLKMELAQFAAGEDPLALPSIDSLDINQFALSPSLAGFQPMSHLDSVELPLDLMDVIATSPDAPPSSPMSDDSGNLSDTSTTCYSSESSTPPHIIVDEADFEEVEVGDYEGGKLKPFSKARPFAKKCRNSFLSDLTEDERLLLEAEGVHIPDADTVLTKAEERKVKKVRRKIKNKMSAQESRRKKKEYVVGLESRVERCTHVNLGLKKKIKNLEDDNLSLLDQLKRLQRQVQKMAKTSGASAGTCLMLFGLCFSVYLNPSGMDTAGSGGSTFTPSGFTSRTLKSMPASLDTESLFASFFKQSKGDNVDGKGAKRDGILDSFQPEDAHYPSFESPRAIVRVLTDDEEEEDIATNSGLQRSGRRVAGVKRKKKISRARQKTKTAKTSPTFACVPGTKSCAQSVQADRVVSGPPATVV